MSQSQIATCPECNCETIYKGTAKRPRITCKKCKVRFYIPTQKAQKEPPKTKSINKLISPQEGGKAKAPLTNSLSSNDLEQRLIMALDSQPNNANLLGKAIDFFIKVKNKSDSMEDEIDMEALKRVGIVAESGH